MTREDKLSHLGVRCCGDIVTKCVFASSNFVVQVVYERSEDADDEAFDLV